MYTFLGVLWVLTILIFVWANFLAQGKRLKVLKNTSFLFWQRILGVILAAALALSIIYSQKFYLYLFSVNLLVLLFFYLQPTPRISRYLLCLFLAVNLIFLATLFI